LLILDNFTLKEDVLSEKDADIFTQMKKSGIKIIFISRKKYFNSPNNIVLQSLGEESNIELFNHYADSLSENMKYLLVTVDNPKYIRDIVALLNNTLAVIVFAKIFALNENQKEAYEKLLDYHDKLRANDKDATDEAITSHFLRKRYRKLIKQKILKSVKLKPIYKYLETINKKYPNEKTILPLLQSLKLKKYDVEILKNLSLAHSSNINFILFYSLLGGYVGKFRIRMFFLWLARSIFFPFKKAIDNFDKLMNGISRLIDAGLVQEIGANYYKRKMNREEMVKNFMPYYSIYIDDSIAEAVLRQFSPGDNSSSLFISNLLYLADTDKTTDDTFFTPDESDEKDKNEKAFWEFMRDRKNFDSMFETAVFHVTTHLTTNKKWEKAVDVFGTAAKYFQKNKVYEKAIFFLKQQVETMEGKFLRNRAKSLFDTKRIYSYANLAFLLLHLNIKNKEDGEKYLEDILRLLKNKPFHDKQQDINSEEVEVKNELQVIFQAGADFKIADIPPSIWGLWIYLYNKQSKSIDSLFNLSQILYIYSEITNGFLRQGQPELSLQYVNDILSILRFMDKHPVLAQLKKIPDFSSQFKDYNKFHLAPVILRNREITIEDAIREDPNNSIAERFHNMAIYHYNNDNDNSLKLSCFYFIRAILLHAEDFKIIPLESELVEFIKKCIPLAIRWQ
jgi:hypothetical protein